MCWLHVKFYVTLVKYLKTQYAIADSTLFTEQNAATVIVLRHRGRQPYR